MTKVLNIDDILNKEPAYSIVIKGVTHDMSAPSVENFLDNLKDLEDLAAAPDVAGEVKITVRMICRVFKTLKEEDVRKWPVEAIERLFAIIRGQEDEASVSEESAEGNAPTAS